MVAREKGTNAYLTVTARARNDDHGSELLRRLQAFIGSIGQRERRGSDVTH
jgi:hypothetical protein